MNTRMPVSGALLVLTALVALSPSAATRIGEAEVREGPRGGPCFTISPREERLGVPDFRAVTVSDGARLLWRLSMPAERSFPLSGSMCVPYGGRVAALPHTHAAELETGKLYYLHIETRPARGKAMPQAYVARFCLTRQRNGSVLVHQIQDGERNGPHVVVCGTPAG